MKGVLCCSSSIIINDLLLRVSICQNIPKDENRIDPTLATLKSKASYDLNACLVLLG